MQRFFYYLIGCYAALACLSAPRVLAQSMPSWSYQTKTGPAHWAEIEPENISCERGKQQSPIALDTQQAAHTSVRDFTFNYQKAPATVTFFNTGLTLQANVASGVYEVTFKGQSYQLMQFHFHTPSEHKLNGKRYPMALHLVHKNAVDHLTVVDVFIQQGRENKHLAAMFTNLSGNRMFGKPFAMARTEIDLAALLPSQQKALVYMGSLTTPPCSEQVNWIVLEQPIEMSVEQIAAFRKVFPDNHRPLQKKNHRFVIEE